MKKIFEYFKPKNSLNYYEIQKIKGFIYFNVFLFIASPTLLLLSMQFRTANIHSIQVVLPAATIFAVLNLFILKKIGLKHAGNILSFVIVLMDVMVLNVLDPDVSIFIKYTQSFYLALGILVITAMFSTKKILFLNTILLLASTTRVLFYGLKYTESESVLLTSGYIYHTVSLLMSVTIVYFLIQFAENSILQAQKDALVNKKQKESLQNLMNHIQLSSANFSKAGEQLSNLALQLAQNANEQASSSEEIASAMDEMLVTTIAKTSNAEFANLTTENTMKSVTNSSEIFMNMISTVSKISEKVGIITEIADKTDILSINAAIEASRASDSGNGFSVIAQEIRKLADKTKIASVEIDELSAKGKLVSQKAKENLEQLTPDIKKSAELVNEIVHSSREMEKGIRAINSSVIQLSEIGSKNSVAAEEMSSSSEELSTQASQLEALSNSNAM